MKTDFKTECEDYVTSSNDNLEGVIVLNYHFLNTIVNQLLSYLPTKEDVLCTENLVGFWKVKTLKTK